MCGIAGCWSPSLNQDALMRARDALAHRGPDGGGEKFDKARGVALVHTRLAIIDLSPTGHQPMLSSDGGVALAFNGEIYNYRELMSELEAEGVRFRGRSDSEVLLELYLRYGLSMLPRLNGIFAFAIHDARRDELLLARDAMGVKPLYVCTDALGFAFASEIKALLVLPVNLGTLDAGALARYLSFLWCPGEGTPFRAVRKLAPGAAMVVKAGRVVQEWRWYEPPVCHGQRLAARTLAGHGRARPHMNRETAITAVRDGLRRAVHRQLVADVPVGAFLSGGLDSSAVVAFAREQMADLHCFTIEQVGGADAGDADDLPYAQRVAQHLDVELDVVRVDAAQMARDLEEMVWQLDEPLADPAPLNVLYISRLARQHEIKVLLSGAGGDDLFTGYRRHLALRYERLWTWLPHRIQRALGNLAGKLDQRSPIGRRISRLFAPADMEGDGRLASYFIWSRREDLLPLLSPPLRDAVAEVAIAQPMLDFLGAIPQSTSRMHRLLALEQRFFLADHNLNYTDKMAMAAGVEVRVPFLDPELVELAAHVPDCFMQRGSVSKWVLKKAMEPFLPLDVIYRPKSGFGAPLRRWMRYELRELLGDVLSEHSVRKRGLFDEAAVQRLIADNDAGRKDSAYTLLSLLCIEIWCRRFVDASTIEEHRQSASVA